VRPRKGVRIKPISPVDMAEIYDVLTELESLAAFDATRQNPTTQQLVPLENAIDRMDAALATDDREVWAAADEEFHTELVKLGGNSRVQSIVAMMSDQTRRARDVTLYMRPSPLQSNHDHRQVLEAIKSGNANRAKMLHSEHRRAAKQTLVHLLKSHKLAKI